MNSVMNTVNNVKNTILKLVSHPLLDNSFVKGCLTLMLTFLSFITSMVYLPLLCFVYAFTKTVLYSHVIKSDKSDSDIKKGHTELVNNWLVYCLAYTSYTIMNGVLGGLFLMIGRVITTVFVLDLTFLRGNDSTLSVVLFQMAYKLVKKYREHPLLIQTINAIDYFESNIYPERRLGIYNMVMGLVSKHFTKDDSPVESATTPKTTDNEEDREDEDEDEDELVKSVSNYKATDSQVKTNDEETINENDEDNDDHSQKELEQVVQKQKKSSKNRHKKKKNKQNLSSDQLNQLNQSPPKQLTQSISEPTINELLSSSQILDDDDRELDETD